MKLDKDFVSIPTGKKLNNIDSDGTISLCDPIDEQLEEIFDIIGERFNIKYRDVMDMDEKQKKQLIRNLKIDSINE